MAEDLSNAEVLGGVVITIGVDPSQAVAAEKIAKTAATNISALQPKLSIGLDSQKLEATLSTAKNIVVSAGPQLAIATSATINLPHLQSQTGQAVAIVARARPKLEITAPVNLALPQLQAQASKAVAIVRDASAKIQQLRPTSATWGPNENWYRAVSSLGEGKIVANASVKRIVSKSIASARATEMEESAGGGGGAGIGRNIFSPRGIGALIPGGLTAAMVATEAIRTASGFVEANRIESHPDRILRDMSKPGELHDPSSDQQMRAVATTLARLEGEQKRIETLEAIPLLGSTVIKLFDTIAGTSDDLQQKVIVAQRQIESHRVALQMSDTAQDELAKFSGISGAELRIRGTRGAEQAKSLAGEDNAGLLDPEAIRAVARSRAVASVEQSIGAKQESAQPLIIQDQMRAIAAGGAQDTRVEYESRRAAERKQLISQSPPSATEQKLSAFDEDTRAQVQSTRAWIAKNADMIREHSTAFTKYIQPSYIEKRESRVELQRMDLLEYEKKRAVERKTIASQIAVDPNQDKLKIFDLETGAGREKIAREQNARITENKSAAEASQLRAVQQPFEAQIKELKSSHATAVDLAPAGEKGSLRARYAAEESEKIIDHERQLGADRERLVATASANQLQIIHSTFDAEMVVLRAENDAKLKLADASMKATVAAANASSEALAQTRENERRRAATITDTARSISAQFAVALDPMSARVAQFDADAQNELASAQSTDRERIRQRQETERNALVSEQKFQVDESTKDLQARETSAKQFIAGRREEAGFTKQLRAGLSEVEHSSPQLRAQTKAAVFAEMEEMRSGLTGEHGGTIVSGQSDLGAIQAQILEARARGPETKAIRGDITAAEKTVRDWNGPPPIAAPVDAGHPLGGPFGGTLVAHGNMTAMRATLPGGMFGNGVAVAKGYSGIAVPKPQTGGGAAVQGAESGNGSEASILAQILELLKNHSGQLPMKPTLR